MLTVSHQCLAKTSRSCRRGYYRTESGVQYENPICRQRAKVLKARLLSFFRLNTSKLALMTFFVYSMHSYDVIIYSTERHSVIMPDTLMLEFFVALSEKAEISGRQEAVRSHRQTRDLVRRVCSIN
jgi:hypothetical protein